MVSTPTIITIEKEHFPTKQFSMSFKVPTYGDYRAARRRYPKDRQQESNRVPYSLEEMLLAMCMEEVDGSRILTDSTDVIERLKPFPVSDLQFAVRTFLEIFYASREEVIAAKDIAERQSSTNYQKEYTLSREHLPSNSYSITVRVPNSGVQMEVDSRFSSASATGCSMEELLLAHCLSSIDGQAISHPKDIISVLDSWSIADVQFVGVWFVNLFCIDEQSASSAVELGKSMKAKLLGVNSTGNKKKLTTPTA